MSKYNLPPTIVEIENHSGHWKIGTGASGLVDEVRESRKIASRVHAILRASKVPSTYFHDDTSANKNQNLTTLVKHHNADTNGLVVSWHLNSSGAVTQSGIGTEVLYVNEKWKPLAEALSAAIAKAGNFKNRGAKPREDLFVLNNTKEPAILVETFFVNSTADVAMYNRYFEDICQAAAKVLAEALGKSIPTVTEDKTKEAEIVAKETYEKDAAPATWSKEAVEWAKENGVSDGTYLKRPATREEVITMIYNVQNQK